jgi:hypothetical protein
MAELDALSDGFSAILKKSQEVSEPAYQKIQAAEEDYAKTKGELGVKAAELKAKSARGSAGGQLAVYDKYEKELMAPAPTIQYSADTADGMKNLAMLLPIAGMMMGGSGQLSGVGALKAMSGVLEGHKQGNQDRIALEQKNFEQQMQNWKIHQEQIKGAFERALQRAKINASAAQSGLQVDLAKLDAQLLLADVKKNGIIDPLKRFNAMNEKVTTAIEGAVGKMYSEKPENYTVNGQTRLMTPSEAIAMERSGATVVKAGVATGRTSAINQQIQRRLATATTQAVEAFKAITDMPSEATTGIIPFLGSKEGVINYIKSATGRALSSDEANVLNTYFKGVGRNLATIEASGVATGLVGLSSSFESLAPMSGDSDYAVAAKLAEGRAVIENGIRVALTDPSITPEQKALLDENLKGIQEAIPYTRQDLNQALKAKSEVGGTLGTTTTGATKPDANLPKPTTEAEFNALPKGSRYIDPDDNKIYVK